jgi:thymidine kinase
MNNPEFVIFTGPMFGGKTSRMISLLERAGYQKKRIVLFKPLIDNRNSNVSVVSHNGLTWGSKDVKRGKDILKEIEKETYDIIAVDEAFMIKGVGDILIKLFKKGYTIYVSSIQLSTKLKPFREIEKIMPWATKIEVCPAVCPYSGNEAFYTKSYVKTSHIQVGGMQIYHPVSYHYNPEFKK